MQAIARAPGFPISSRVAALLLLALTAPGLAAASETVIVVSDGATIACEGGAEAVAKGQWLGVIERQGERLQVQVCRGKAIRRGWLDARHAQPLADGDVDLAAEALQIAKALHPQMDVRKQRDRLDALAARVAGAARAGTPRERVRLLGTKLFVAEGFSVGVADTLDAALERRQGNCMGLSVLYLCLARRLGLPLHLVTAPDHAFVRYDDGRERFDIETTLKGGIRDGDDYLADHLGREASAQAGGIHLESLTDPQAVGVLWAQCGFDLCKRGEFAAACERFARAVEINPRHAEPYSNWGNALNDLGDPQQACEKCQLAAETNPRYAAAWCNWGVGLVRLAEPAAACAKFAKALDLSPGSPEAWSNWAVALICLGRYDEACAKCDEAVKRNASFAEAHCTWGLALGKAGKPQEACSKFIRATELSPRYATAHCNLGIALASLGEKAQACQRLARAVACDPESAKAHYNYGVALLERGDDAAAAERLEAAIDLKPTAAALYACGLALERLDRLPEAREKLKRAAELDPAFKPPPDGKPRPAPAYAWDLGIEDGAAPGSRARPGGEP